MNRFEQRSELATLENQKFDVLIVGGGINGCSAAQHLAADGYSVLLVEKNDFASGASNRSSRLLHCGLRYLSPDKSPLEFLIHPKKLRTAITMASRSLRGRRELFSTNSRDLNCLNIAIPIYKGAAYSGWQVDLGAALLRLLNAGGPAIDYRRQKPKIAATRNPLISCLRAPEELSSIFSFRDYQFNSPERLCIDALLAAKRHGATVLNYTELTKLNHLSGKHWEAVLEDHLTGHLPVNIRSKVVLNLSGVWVDKVNQLGTRETPPTRKVVAVKGTHMVVRIPENFRGHGIAGLSRATEHLFCLPWGDRHYIGSTETLYTGDIEDVRPTKEELEFLLDEINYMLPKLNITRGDIEFSWSGTRPITFDPHRAKGRRMPSGIFHSLQTEGMQDAIAVTWGWIMHHRETARELVGHVNRIIKPSSKRTKLSHDSSSFPINTNTVALVPEFPDITLGAIRHIAEHEAPAHLEDIFLRRTPIGWHIRLSNEVVRRTAECVAPVLGWDETTIEKEITHFETYMKEQHLSG